MASGSSSRGLVLLLITSGFFITGLLFDYMPMIIDDHIKRTIELATNEEIIGFWSKPPIEVQTYYWLYDVVNAEQFTTTGAKAQVRKVGPFHFVTRVEKRILNLSANKFRLTYNSTRYSRLNESYSADLLDQPLTLLNPVMVSIIEGMRVNSREMDLQTRNIAAGTINKLLERYNETLLHNVTARTALMGKDIPITDKLKRMAKAFGMGDKLPDLASVTKFGYASIANGTWAGPFEIYTGYQETARSLGDLISYKGKRRLDYYEGKCNRLQTSAGELRPMPVEADKQLEMFQPNFCRIIHLKATGLHKLREGQAISYVVAPEDLMSAASNPDNRCYCTNLTEADDHCSLEGVIELAPCSYNAPIMVSLSNVPIDQRIINTIQDFDPDMLRGDVEQLVNSDDEAQIVILRRVGVPIRADLTITMFMKVIRDPMFRQTVNVPEVSYVPLMTVREKVLIPAQLAQIIVNLESFLSLTYHIKVVMYLTAIVLLCWLTSHYYCHNAPAQLEGSSGDQRGGQDDGQGPDRRRHSSNMANSGSGGGGGGGGGSNPDPGGNQFDAGQQARGRQSSAVDGNEQTGDADRAGHHQTRQEPLSAASLVGVAGPGGDGPISPGAAFRLNNGTRARRSTVIALTSQLSTVDERPIQTPPTAAAKGPAATNQAGQSVDTASWNERANSGDSNRSLPPSRRTSRLNSLDGGASDTTTMGGPEEGAPSLPSRGAVSTKPSSVARLFSKVDSELRARNNQVASVQEVGGALDDNEPGRREELSASGDKPAAGVRKRRRNGWFMSVYSNLVRMLNGLRNTINEDGAGQLGVMQSDYQDRQLEMLAGKIDNWYSNSSVGDTGDCMNGAPAGGEESAGDGAGGKQTTNGIDKTTAAAAAAEANGQEASQEIGQSPGPNSEPGSGATLVRVARAAPAYEDEDQIRDGSEGSGGSSAETVRKSELASGTAEASSGNDSAKDGPPSPPTATGQVPTVVHPNADSSTQTDDPGPSDFGGGASSMSIITSLSASASAISDQDANGGAASESGGGGATASSSPPRPAIGVPVDEQLAAEQHSEGLGQSSPSGLALAEAATNQGHEQQQQQQQRAETLATPDEGAIEKLAKDNRQLVNPPTPTQLDGGGAPIVVLGANSRGKAMAPAKVNSSDRKGRQAETLIGSERLTEAARGNYATAAAISGGGQWDSSNGASLTLSNDYVDEDVEVEEEDDETGEDYAEEEEEEDGEDGEEGEEEELQKDEAAKAATLKQIEAALSGSPQPKNSHEALAVDKHQARLMQHHALAKSLARLDEEQLPETSLNGGGVGDNDDDDEQPAKSGFTDGIGAERGPMTCSSASAATKRDASSSSSSLSSQASHVTQIARSSHSGGRQLDASAEPPQPGPRPELVVEDSSQLLSSSNQSDSEPAILERVATTTKSVDHLNAGSVEPEVSETTGAMSGASEEKGRGDGLSTEVDESSCWKQQQQQQQSSQLSKLGPNEVVEKEKVAINGTTGSAGELPIDGQLHTDGKTGHDSNDGNDCNGKIEPDMRGDLSAQTISDPTTAPSTRVELDTSEEAASAQFIEADLAQRALGGPFGPATKLGPRITSTTEPSITVGGSGELDGQATAEESSTSASKADTNNRDSQDYGKGISSGSLSKSTKTSSCSSSSSLPAPEPIVEGNSGGNGAAVVGRAGQLNGGSARLDRGVAVAAAAAAAAAAAPPRSAGLLSASGGQLYPAKTEAINSGSVLAGINKRQINEIFARSWNVSPINGASTTGTSRMGDAHQARPSALGQSRPISRLEGRGRSPGPKITATTPTTTSTSVILSNGLKAATSTASVYSQIPNGFGSTATTATSKGAGYNNNITSTTFPSQHLQQQQQLRQAGLMSSRTSGGVIISSNNNNSSSGSSSSSSSGGGSINSVSIRGGRGNNILNEKIISQQRSGAGAGTDGVAGSGASFSSNQRSANETTGNRHQPRRVQPAGA